MLESQTKRQFLANGLEIAKVTNGGRGVILSSETNRRVFMRAPLDVV
jgi:hypothetical protein